MEQHRTNGYKSSHTISPAIIKRENVQATRTHTELHFLHRAPAEEVFKDPSF